MVKKTIPQIIALALILILSGSDSLAQKRISFRKGTSSATVRGKIGAKGYLEYLVNGQAGQVMSIEITSGNGAVGQAASGNGTNGNGNGFSGCFDAAWARSVTDRIRRFFYYPQRARTEHVTGVVVVHLTVKRNGQLNQLEIGKSSGDASLDDAAYDMVKKAQPLPRIPDHMHVDMVDGELPIAFGITGVFKTSTGSCK